jgi:hypothetical protein
LVYNRRGDKVILSIMTVYNELRLMPLNLRWCEMNGLDMYVIDNCSNDGTWEWLQNNNIPSHRLDTGGAFSLKMIQPEMLRTLDRIKPDWVVKNDADAFFLHKKPIKDMLPDDHNIIRADFLSIKRTDGSPYYYNKHPVGVRWIHKYMGGTQYIGDIVKLPFTKEQGTDGFWVNCGMIKTAEEREETLKRRQLAWKLGEPKQNGTHYLEGHERGWKWEKYQLQDIRKTKYFTEYNKFINLLTECI